MKECSTCKVSKPVDQFNKNKARRDGLQTICRLCQRNYYKNYYETVPKEKERLKQSNKERLEYIKYLVRGKKSQPCMDCDIQYPYYVMDFDHVEGEKEFNIARAAADGRSINVIMVEISKCEVVCANCHRERTHARLNE